MPPSVMRGPLCSVNAVLLQSLIGLDTYKSRANTPILLVGLSGISYIVVHVMPTGVFLVWIDMSDYIGISRVPK